MIFSCSTVIDRKAGAMRTGPQWELEAKIGRRLHNLRTFAGVSKAALAKKMKERGFTTWHYNTVTHLENGERHFQVAEIIALADVLDVGSGELLPGLEAHAPMDPRARAELEAAGVDLTVLDA